MRNWIMMAAALAATVCFAGSALAVIGWAGNVFPNHNTDIVPTGPVTVYAQVWKEGVTDMPGQGPDIAGTLYYTTDIAPQQSVAMAYNTDIGNNDEYKGDIPQAALVGASWVDVTVIFTDLTDMTDFEVLADQNGNPPPFRYNVVPVLPNDVNVTFTLCMSGVETLGPPCVIGSADEIGAWGTGVNMVPEGSHPELWTVTVTFAAGGNPSFEYKYKRDDCSIWEDVPNRAVTLPTDGTTDLTFDPDSWNNLPIGCDLGTTLAEDKVVCFQVCLQGIDNTGGVCVTGNLAELTGWGDGIPTVMVGPDLYQACLVFEAGRPIPIDIEYKFKKDDCQTWEGMPYNRLATVDNSSPPEQTLTSAWEDGGSICEPVASEEASWGTLKTLYR